MSDVQFTGTREEQIRYRLAMERLAPMSTPQGNLDLGNHYFQVLNNSQILGQFSSLGVALHHAEYYDAVRGSHGSVLEVWDGRFGRRLAVVSGIGKVEYTPDGIESVQPTEVVEY